MRTESKENLIDVLQEAGMLYMVLGSLISADSLIGVESYQKAYKMLEGLKTDFDSSSLKDDLKIRSLLEKADAIIERDLQTFLEREYTQNK